MTCINKSATCVLHVTQVLTHTYELKTIKVAGSRLMA